MRKYKRKYMAMILCILSLFTSFLPQMSVCAASANVEYTGGISLTEIVQQLNQQLGLSSTVENWTFYTTGTAEVHCSSFLMDHTNSEGKTTTYNMMNYIGMASQATDAYQLYLKYMEDFRQKESSGYFPINTNKQDIPLRTVDMGNVYYNIQTPFPVEGTSHTVISYYGSVSWNDFLNCIGVGVSVSMQCRGTTYTVDFVAPSAGSSGQTGADGTQGGGGGATDIAQSGSGSSGTGTQTGGSLGGGTQSGSAGSGGSAGTVIQAQMYDHTKSSAEQPNAIVPGRTSISSDALLQLTASTESVPTIKTSGESRQPVESEIVNETISDLPVDEIEYEIAFNEGTDGKWKIYSVDDTSDRQAENAGRIFHYATLGVAGLGLLRILFLFGKLRKGI